jgi:superfamily I DNA/RNA helicase
MHLAKGLEFGTVVVMACDDEVIPLQERIEAIGDEADLREVYETERHLLYVACSRARDRLLVAKRSSIISGSGPRLWRTRSAPLRSAEWFAMNALLGQR